jgi:predicted acyl esterase
MGSQGAEDCYDIVNGEVDMAGSSALAIIQWHVASLRPPNLAASAPWEGLGDIYRERFCRGGVFSMSKFDLITHFIIKKTNPASFIEDMNEMHGRFPVSN